MQLRQLREYAARRGWETREFIDHGVSGAETRRPFLAALTQALRSREFDVLLVWKFDRIFRSTRNMLAYTDELKHLNVEFVSLTEQMDTGTPQGRLLFTVLAAIAEFERDLIRERVCAGLAAAKARGQKLGRPKKSVDVLAIMRELDAGYSYGDIAKRRNISKSHVCRIVSRERMRQNDRRARE